MDLFFEKFTQFPRTLLVAHAHVHHLCSLRMTIPCRHTIMSASIVKLIGDKHDCRDKVHWNIKLWDERGRDSYVFSLISRRSQSLYFQSCYCALTFQCSLRTMVRFRHADDLCWTALFLHSVLAHRLVHWKDASLLRLESIDLISGLDEIFSRGGT